MIDVWRGERGGELGGGVGGNGEAGATTNVYIAYMIYRPKPPFTHNY